MTAEKFLWYDNEGSLEHRLLRAAAAYQRRRKQVANVCELLPQAVNGEKIIAGLVLRPKPNALKNHYWLWREA